MNFFKQNLILIIILNLLVFYPLSIAAQVATSTNYKLEDSQFDFGGGTSNSANFKSRDGLYNVESGPQNSSGFKLFGGFFHEAFPGVPDMPSLTNTGGILYNSLDFVIGTGGNSQDTLYAIAISSDNFATTNFVQTDNTISASTAWQTYTAWGGIAGQRITGLLPATTYKIKVKARYGLGSESGYSLIAQAATVNPSLSMSIYGVAINFGVAGATTTVSTTATSVDFSSLQINQPSIAAQQIVVSTNSASGYTTSILQNHNLTTSFGATIPAVVGTNSSPISWPTLSGSGQFGYHTTDSSLCSGVVGRFAGDDTYAAIDSNFAYEIACSSSNVNLDSTYIVYKITIGASQPAGKYSNIISYITSPSY